ncbi:hypothetical protein ZTR_03512 [Talaromyces verruculosus]|nr:hypothetical protein ZTR_03512 [Talaromyces verruculosus]
MMASGSLIPLPSKSVSEVEIGGQTFKQVDVLMQQLRIWSTTLPPAIYQTYLDEGADFLTMYVDTQEAKNEEVLAEYYNLALSTHPDFETYRKSAKYSQIWGRIDAAAENRAKNEQKRTRAREEVKKNWGSRAARLARKIPDYDEAMKYLSRALYSRRVTVRPERSCSLQPGGTDLVNALELFEKKAIEVTLTDEALNAFVPNFYLSIGENGLLQYGKGRPRVTAIEEIEVQGAALLTGVQPSPEATIAQPPASDPSATITGVQPALNNTIAQPPASDPTGTVTGVQPAPNDTIAQPPPPDPTATVQVAPDTTIGPSEPTTAAVASTQPNLSTTIVPPDPTLTVAVTGVQPRPASAMSTDIKAENNAEDDAMIIDPSSGNALEVLSDSGSECLCVLNDYMDIDTMIQIDNRPAVWSYTVQRETLSFIVQHAAMLHGVCEDNKARGSRQLCQRHVRELARGIGLLLEGVSYETHLTRIDYIATTVSSFEEFNRLVLQGPTTRKWFRNSTLRTTLPQQHNPLHPYRFSPLRGIDTIVDDLVEKMKSNGDKILSDILSCFGVKTSVLPSIHEAGFLDIPKIFSWLFVTFDEMSAAEIAFLEAEILNRHLSPELQSHSSSTHHLMSHQYGLVQQIVETYPVFYLLSIMSQPPEHRSLFFVAYPNPIIHTRGAKNIPFKFEARPGRRQTERRKDPLRAIIPLSEENSHTCDRLLLGTSSEEGMRAFLDCYREQAAINDTYELDPEVVIDIAAEGQRFSLPFLPIGKGGRFKDCIATTTAHGKQLLVGGSHTQQRCVVVRLNGQANSVHSNGYFGIRDETSWRISSMAGE